MLGINSLDAETLTRLYVEEGKTETEIARMFGTYQVKIGRLRREYCIPTLCRTDRLGLPAELTPRLRSILVGSMLGDGGLRPTGSKTVGYVEHHSVKQKAYLDWKVMEWGPFVSTIPPSDKGTFRGFRIITHGCQTLWPFWEMFYPEGSGAKTFTNLPVDWVDDLALAVWFMDDGSKDGRYVKFSVGPNKADQRAQMQMLRRLGLNGKLYGEGGDVRIGVNSRTGVNRFLDLVRPHMHPSMAYKLEVQPSKGGVAPRDLLTPARLQPLLDRGFSAQAMAGVFGVSRGSISRALDRMGAPQRPTGRPRRSTRKELDVESAAFAIKLLDPTLDDFKEKVLALLSRTELPLELPTEELALTDWERLRRAPTHLEGDTFVKVSHGGSKLCQRFFPHRWGARYRGNPSVKEAWYDPKYLKRAIQFQVSVNDPVTPVRVFRALQAVVRGPTNFRPCFAKALVEALCPEGGLVLDPCAGYGGRAVGTLAAGRRYVGVDPHPKAGGAFDGLRALVGELGFHNCPFEEVELGRLKADMVFTSPPYFSVERYSDDTTQSWVRYSSWEAWIEGFLRPFVVKSKAHLKSGGLFCVNTKDVRIGRREFPIVGELTRLAQEVGFELERILTVPLGRIGKKAPLGEPLLVFQTVARPSGT